MSAQSSFVSYQNQNQNHNLGVSISTSWVDDMMHRFPLVILVLTICAVRCRMAKAEEKVYTLASVRENLIRQEDTIIYALIERAKFPFNSHTYDEKYAQIPGFSGSLFEFVVKNTEDIQAKVLFVTITLFLACLFMLSCFVLGCQIMSL